MSNNSTLGRKLQKAKRSLERWRETKQGRHIPEAVWNEVVEVATSCGVAPVAKALRLDYYALKDRVSKRKVSLMPSECPAFIEFLPTVEPPQPLGSCIVEVEATNGARMWVTVETIDVRGLAHLVRDFAN